jgi:nucleoside 2-deoxyribosyltransferase
MSRRFKVYVAASSKQMDRASQAMAQLRAAGHEVVHDWPAIIEARGVANPLDATQDERWDWAIDDLQGVKRADVLWLLVPNEEGAGAFVELGYALALGKPVIASGVYLRSIFTAMAACYDRDDQAFQTEFGS